LINLSQIRNHERLQDLMDKGYETKGAKITLEDIKGNKETVDLVFAQRGVPGPSLLLVIEGGQEIMFVGAASRIFYQQLLMMIPQILQENKGKGGEQSE